MKIIETPITIRTYEPQDKQKVYELFKNSNLSVLDFGEFQS